MAAQNPMSRKTKDLQRRQITSGSIGLKNNVTFDSVHLKAVHLQPICVENLVTKKDGTIAYDSATKALCIYNGDLWTPIVSVPSIEIRSRELKSRTEYDSLPPESYAMFSDKDFTLFSDTNSSDILKIDLLPMASGHVVRSLTVPKMDCILGAIDMKGNTFLGTSSFSLKDQSRDNTCIGENSGSSITTGTDNVSVGSKSMISMASGTRNTAVGCLSMGMSSSSCDNVALGHNTLPETSGCENVAVGSRSQLTSGYGFQNTSVGAGSLSSNVSGLLNTAVGYNSGKSVVTNNNVLIGANTDVGSPSHTGCIVLGAGGITSSTNQLVIHGPMSGMAKMNNGRSIVYTTSVTLDSRILLTINEPDGKIGMVYVALRKVGEGFTILSSSPSDLSVVAWFMFDS